MSAPARKLRVGVTLNLRDATQSIWENGIFQNCAFLAQLFNHSPAVEEAVIVAHGAAAVPSPAMLLEHTGLRCVGLDEAMSLDVVIEMSALLPADWAAAFRARGGRYAWMRVGNDYVIDIERAMFGKPAASLYDHKPYDAIWTLPQYEEQCRDYFGIPTRAPVKVLPHLWTPLFFDIGIRSLPAGTSFGYVAGKPRWRVCAFEPNVCMVKTSIIPMLACEEAYRRRPNFLEQLRVCNTLHLKDHVQFLHMARSLDVVQHGVATFEGRFAVYEFMANFGDCIVSHQWANAQNYLYYEALYGGYPLVHNSPLLRGHGYYYPGFDCEAGGAALLRAHAEHDLRIADAKRSTRELLQSLDTAHPANVEAYTRELLALFA
ncbi:DUF2827 domain-containing protein [Ramlibacter albus]|uniref:DUF2827 domain-containing protein n=1 Tax=Ramlibacter albus TaxID=2079448 RepID=A0A923S0N9_9BURK|nr:DUF2827 domain-containing protein [Ramlibacter albus]MBC5763564.1 DUF2827 domain-containing protein [Ramlibacter albus]